MGVPFTILKGIPALLLFFVFQDDGKKEKSWLCIDSLEHWFECVIHVLAGNPVQAWGYTKISAEKLYMSVMSVNTCAAL